jgi:predicted permease
MKFDTKITAAAFVVLLAALLGGTFTSPMSQDTKMMVAGGQLVFLVLTLLLGVKHGEYRATR